MKKNYSRLKYVAICLLAASFAGLGYYLLVAPEKVNPPISPAPHNITEELEESANDTSAVTTRYWWWDADLGKSIAILATVAVGADILFFTKISKKNIFLPIGNNLGVEVFSHYTYKRRNYSWKLTMCKVCLFLIGVVGLSYTTYTKLNNTLLACAEEGSLDNVKYLVEQGANIDAKNKEGDTALLYSAYNGNLEGLQFLHQQGANIHYKNKHGETALILSAQEGQVTCLKYLTQQGASHQDKDIHGNTAFLWSAREGRVDCVKYLHQQGADINSSNNYDDTALIYSACHGHLACVKYLVQQGADITLKGNENKTALQWAQEQKCKDVVNYLQQLKPSTKKF